MLRQSVQRIALVALLPLVLVSACASPETVITPVTIVETPVLNHYVIYNSTDDLFSIAYPPEWELEPSAIATNEDAIAALLSVLATGELPTEASYLFTGGLPPNYLPVIIIMAEPLPATITTHAELVDIKVSSIKAAAPDFKEFARIETTMGGRKATLIDYQITLGGMVRHDVSAFFVADGLVWTATCVSSRQDFETYKDDMYQVALSLRVPGIN